MTARQTLMPQSEDEDAMATVIPLVAPGRDRSTPAAIEVADADARSSVPVENAQLLRALGVLHRRAGDQAADLPAALGRVSLRIEALLADGPTAIDPSSVDPARAIASAERILKATASLFELIKEEGPVLGEVLSSDLNALRLDALAEVADAVLGLSEAPRAVSIWGSAVAAEAAEMVLHVAAEDLRAAARSHEQLYQRFTEDIWHVRDTVLHAGRRRWRLISRGRLRRELRAASRTGRLHGSLTAAVMDVLEVRAARERLTSMAPILSHHLAELDRGPLTDADAALMAVGAVRRLQATIGDLLDEDRLRQLLLADAFRSPDVVSPAVNLRNALRAWGGDVTYAGGADACRLTLDELARWAAEVSDMLPALAEGHEAVVRIGAPAPTLRALVDVLLVREHVQDLLADEQLQSGSNHEWSAS